jgi:hypothetical protein
MAKKVAERGFVEAESPAEAVAVALHVHVHDDVNDVDGGGNRNSLVVKWT